MKFVSSHTPIASVFLVLLTLIGASAAEGQQAGDQTGQRTASVMTGVGNSLGWLGGAAEIYFLGDRVSAFIAVGYTPAIEAGESTGATGAVGVRGFTEGQRHRGFIEISWSQVLVETTYAPGPLPYPGVRETSSLYGPGLLVGYQYVASGGFTLVVSGGVGSPGGANPLGPLFNLGVGYTWRR